MSKICRSSACDDCRWSSKKAINQLSTRLALLSLERSCRNFCNRGSLMTATNWLGGWIFSSFWINSWTSSISSNVTEVCLISCDFVHLRNRKFTSWACEVYTWGMTEGFRALEVALRATLKVLFSAGRPSCVFWIWSSWISPSRCRHSWFGCYQIISTYQSQFSKAHMPWTQMLVQKSPLQRWHLDSSLCRLSLDPQEAAHFPPAASTPSCPEHQQILIV